MKDFEWNAEALRHHEQQLAQIREAAVRHAARDEADDPGVCTWMTQHGTTGQWR